MRAETRHVFLLVDNVSSHRPEERLPNVVLCMLPPNTNAFSEAHDGGVISSFKAQISKFQHRYVADCFDDVLRHISYTRDDCVGKDIDSLFNVDVLVAMRWAKQRGQRSRARPSCIAGATHRYSTRKSTSFLRALKNYELAPSLRQLLNKVNPF